MELIEKAGDEAMRCHFSPLFKESCRGTSTLAVTGGVSLSFQSSIQRVMPWNLQQILDSSGTFPEFQSSIQRVMPWNKTVDESVLVVNVYFSPLFKESCRGT